MLTKSYGFLYSILEFKEIFASETLVFLSIDAFSLLRIVKWALFEGILTRFNEYWYYDIALNRKKMTR